MATTTPNFGWSVPTSSDLVKNGAVAIETLGDSIDASMAELKGGTTGQVLSKTSNTDMNFTWTGASTSWTPTITSLTIGNGTIAGSYVKIGKLVHARFIATLGSTSSVTGNFIVSSPTTANGAINANIFYEDSGVQLFNGVYEQSGSALYLRAPNATTTYVSLTATSSTVPFTWGSGDKLIVALTYEEA
jgi:hypothetical protein